MWRWIGAADEKLPDRPSGGGGPATPACQSMFETRTDAWRAVGLQDEVRRRDSRRARLQALLLLPLLAAVIAGYALRHRLFSASADTPVQIATVVAILILGWAIARDVGRAAAPALFRHLDPASAGTVGFLMRLATLAIALLAALSIAQVSPTTLVAGGASLPSSSGWRRSRRSGTCSPASCWSARARSASVSAFGCRPASWPAKQKAW